MSKLLSLRENCECHSSSSASWAVNTWAVNCIRTNLTEQSRPGLHVITIVFLKMSLWATLEIGRSRAKAWCIVTRAARCSRVCGDHGDSAEIKFAPEGRDQAGPVTPPSQH